jgi:hypothetical protein
MTDLCQSRLFKPVPNVSAYSAKAETELKLLLKNSPPESSRGAKESRPEGLLLEF